MNDIPSKPGSVPSAWPELVASTPLTRPALDRAVLNGELKPLGLGLYTSNLVDEPADILDRHCRRELRELQSRIAELKEASSLISDLSGMAAGEASRTLDDKIASLIRGSNGRKWLQ